MAGRDLSKALHSSRAGGFVAPFALPRACATEMAAGLGRDMCAADITTICSSLARIATYRTITAKAAPQRVKPVDVRASLQAIAAAPSEALARAKYRNADSFTAGAIDAHRYRTRGRATTAQAAARQALAAPQETAPGRRVDGAQRLAITEAMRAWVALGGDPQARAWVYDGRESGRLQFVLAFLRAAGWPNPDPSDTAKRARGSISPL